MSKKLGQAATTAIIGDFFGDRESDKFFLKRPPNFEFFNSLRLGDIDRFAGVTVALLDSVFWQHPEGRVASLMVDNHGFYSGSHTGPLPPGVMGCEVEQWLVVASYSLDERDEHVGRVVQALEDIGCIKESEQNESLFMFLRAWDALTFNPSLSADAEENIVYQARADGYQGTPVSDVFPYYEKFVAFRVNKDSHLAGRSVFWYSFLVAARWRGSVARHINAQALSFLEKIYEENLWHFPIDNARLAIVASHFKHTFVDLYRCLEGLYALPRCMMVKDELNLSQKATHLARTLREKLAWRRTEKDSLELLLFAAEPDKLDVSLVNSCLLDPLRPVPRDGMLNEPARAASADGNPQSIEEWRSYAAKKLAARIYSIRNQFVHQLDDVDKEEVKDGTEAVIVALLAQICAILYSKYEAEF